MSDAVTGTLRDWVSLFLLGIGIQFSAHEYIGGLFMALAGAAISRAWEKEQSRRKGLPPSPESAPTLLLIAGTAFFVATVVASAIYSSFPGWSAPLVMASAGFASRRIIYMALGVVDGLAQRGDAMAQRIIDKFLPRQGGRENDSK